MKLNGNRGKLANTSYVPSTTPKRIQSLCFILYSVHILITLPYNVKGLDHHTFDGIYRTIKHSEPETSASYLNAFEQPDRGPINTFHRSTDEISSMKPTPPLENYLNQRNDANREQIQNINSELSDQPFAISPHHVIRSNNLHPGDLMTPMFLLRSEEQNYQAESRSSLDDIIETGSGADPLEDTAARHEEANILKYHGPTPTYISSDQLMTPIFSQLPAQSISDNFDHAPILARRLPKLVATAGSIWRHTLPSDTFQDEDGDMRQLKSALFIDVKNEAKKQQSSSMGDKLSSWLRYDQNTQTLIGFPVDSDVGHHSYTLAVSDKLGNIANETLEIAVRPHQSSRAATHSFTLNQIELTPNNSSIIDTLHEIVRRISEDLYQERSSQNIVVQSYTLSVSSSGSSQNKSFMTLTWYNSSLPINRCNLESVISPILDEGYLSQPNWSANSLSGSNLVPSPNLMKALGPDFRPSTIGINLRGICEQKEGESNDIIQNSSPETNLRVRTRIGKVKWKLGQPIIYRIPDDIFVIDRDSGANQNLTLLLHTIDGLTLELDKNYNFLEFDQELRTIYGLPFEATRHSGQRELLLTAKHTPSNQIARETFIFDIEPQDLTTINNRAFRVSLYFMTRTNVFGPKERVNLSQRMVSALDMQDLNLDHDKAIQEFTVIQVQKFRTGSNVDNSASLSDPSNAWRYHDKIHLVDDEDSSPGGTDPSLFNVYTNNESTYFYKLTWTNETIGSRGDCPVEVIKDNILYALERSMLDYVPPSNKPDDPHKNDSVRFYERLRSYFEPELDLIHLRFEPMSACIDALELHDVGNGEVADMADRASEYLPASESEIPPHYVRTVDEPKVKDVSPINSDEYWAIVVLIILVVAIIFVVMMLFMGLHTYRINQEKRFELQMKLAQARQNSMYLSSLVLADQIHPFDVNTNQSLLAPAPAKPMFIEERSSRKPVILDNEKQYLVNGHIELPMQKQTAVQLMGQSIHTTPLKPNMTFTLDSIANLQNMNTSIGPDAMMTNPIFIANQQRTMTLNRRPINNQASMIGRKASMTNLSQSQSILTVASVGSQQDTMSHPQANFFTPLPTFYEHQDEARNV